MSAPNQNQDAEGTETAGPLTRWAWYAYDFGNTAVEFAIPLYLTIWIINELNATAWAFGLASALSSWAVGLSGPYIGVSADENRSRRQWFTVSALAATLLFGLLPFLPRRGTAALLAILLVAMTANYAFQISSLIYNASMLKAAAGVNVVSVSSRGMALSFAGGAAGVLLMESLVSGRLLPGISGRAYALLPAALIFLACCLPGIFAPKLWQKKDEPVHAPPGRLHERMAALWRESAQHHKAGWFLAGYFALNSSVMGLTLYLPLHVQAATGLGGMRLLLVFALVVLMSALGAVAVSLLSPGQTLVRRLVVAGLVVLGLNALVFSLASSLAWILFFASVHGLLSGALVPTVRGAFAQTFPADYQALAFGLFGAVQRVSQGAGALLSPLASAAGGGGATAVGIAAMGVLALVGVPLFLRWDYGRTARP